MKIINAENLILGRMASLVAKQALLGENIVIVNSEKAVIIGKKEFLIKKYKHKKTVGTPNYGPFFMQKPDMFVKRVIRGMLPYKQEKGRKALKRIKCYIGIPSKYEKWKLESIKNIDVKQIKIPYYITVKQLLSHIGKVSE